MQRRDRPHRLRDSQWRDLEEREIASCRCQRVREDCYHYEWCLWSGAHFDGDAETPGDSCALDDAR